MITYALAPPSPAPPSSVVTPGLLGFIVVAGLGVALFFLIRSMNKHLRRVRTAEDRAADEQQRADGPDRTDGTTSPHPRRPEQRRTGDRPSSR